MSFYALLLLIFFINRSDVVLASELNKKYEDVIKRIEENKPAMQLSNVMKLIDGYKELKEENENLKRENEELRKENGDLKSQIVECNKSLLLSSVSQQQRRRQGAIGKKTEELIQKAMSLTTEDLEE